MRERAGGWGLVSRRKGTPFAEARIGTRRGPEVFAYGRTLRTARSGGRHSIRSLGGVGGELKTLNCGVRVMLRESPATICFRSPTLEVSPAEDASRWSRVWVQSVNPL
jgi:hypothetical protein